MTSAKFTFSCAACQKLCEFACVVIVRSLPGASKTQFAPVPLPSSWKLFRTASAIQTARGNCQCCSPYRMHPVASHCAYQWNERGVQYRQQKSAAGVMIKRASSGEKEVIVSCFEVISRKSPRWTEENLNRKYISSHVWPGTSRKRSTKDNHVLWAVTGVVAYSEILSQDRTRRLQTHITWLTGYRP